MGAIATVALLGMAWAAPADRQEIAREENRTQRIGEQTGLVAQELETIVRDLESNRLLTQQENADFVAARDGFDQMADEEVRDILASLVAARQALERARRHEHLRDTISNQQQLIEHLTEELVRIQFRSQLRYLLDEMRTISVHQRLAIRRTQNAAIALAATDSEDIRSETQKDLVDFQDGVWHDWFLVSGQVGVMLKKFSELPFIDTLHLFSATAENLPIERKLAETRDNLRSRRFGLAVSGQRDLAEYFLELLQILQNAGLSPAEERSALEGLIEKTEETLQRQQELRQHTDTLGRDLTGPLREELARQEDDLSALTGDLARETEQVLAAEEAPEPAEEPPGGPGEETQPPEKEQENPWEEAQDQPQPAEKFEPSSPAASDLSQAADHMTQAADELNQGQVSKASEAQQEAVNRLAQALAQLRAKLDEAFQADELEMLAEMFDDQGDVLAELGEIIREQQELMQDTQHAAQAANEPSPAGDQPAAEDGNAQPEPGEPGQASQSTQDQPGEAPVAENQPPAPEAEQMGPPAPEPRESPTEAAEAPPEPAELGENQQDLAGRTEQLTGKVAATPAAPTLAQAVGSMDQAASELGEAEPGEAVPHQGDALRALRKAERDLAEALAEALDAAEAAEWLEQLGELDDLIQQIEQMARQAEQMPMQPAPAMAQQAGNIGQQLGMMAAMPPIGPAMAAQLQQGGQLMQSASGQLEEGQMPMAAGNMHEAANTLRAIRGQMAMMMAAAMAQAQAAAMAAAQAQQGQAMSGQQLAAAAGQQGMRPSNRPARGGKGRGMRGLGPTDFQPRDVIEKDLESGDWSRLPAREREQILQALKERYPARYERVLIRYFRNLSRLEAEN